MTELTTMIQNPIGFAAVIFVGIVALMIPARLAFFGIFFLAIPIVAAIGGLRIGMRRFATHQRTETSTIIEPRTGVPQEISVPTGEAADALSMVEGFRMKPILYYHPKHIWMKREPDGQVRGGFDDFAQRLMGAMRQIDMLTFNIQQIGKSEAYSYLKGWDICSDGKTVRITSPISGRIGEMNDRLGREPSKISDDPYGDGWICTIVPEGDEDPMDEAISGIQTDRWMKDEVNRLRHYISNQGIAVLQDVGELVRNPPETLLESEWQQLVRTFISA